MSLQAPHVTRHEGPRAAIFGLRMIIFGSHLSQGTASPPCRRQCGDAWRASLVPGGMPRRLAADVRLLLLGLTALPRTPLPPSQKEALWLRAWPRIDEYNGNAHYGRKLPHSRQPCGLNDEEDTTINRMPAKSLHGPRSKRGADVIHRKEKPDIRERAGARVTW